MKFFEKLWRNIPTVIIMVRATVVMLYGTPDEKSIEIEEMLRSSAWQVLNRHGGTAAGAITCFDSSNSDRSDGSKQFG